MFMNDQEYSELISEVSKTLKTTKKKESKPEDRDEASVGGEIPLDEVLPPSHGHESGVRIAENKIYYGNIEVESIENRLFKLLETVTQPSASDQTVQKQQEVRTGKVGTTGVLGHSKGDKVPKTAAAAQRQEVDPYATRGKAARAAKKELTSDKDSEQSEEEMPQEQTT